MNFEYKVLLLGGGHSELPIAKTLSKIFGFHVISCGKIANKKTHQYVKEHIFADYSDKSLCYSIFKEKKCDFVVSGCNDFAEITKAYIQNRSNKTPAKTYENTKILHYKDSMLNILEELNPISRRMLIFSSSEKKSAEEFLKKNSDVSSFIIKPTDLSGGKGMSIIRDVNDIDSAIKNALKYSRQKYIVMEKYFSGTNHAMSILYDIHEPIFSFDDIEQHDLSPFAVSGAASYSQLPLKVKKDVIECVTKIWRKLDLGPGLMHAQFIREGDKFIILEITRRCPGDLYPYLVEYATGYSYTEEMLSLSMFGKSYHAKKIQKYNSEKFILRQCVYNTYNKNDKSWCEFKNNYLQKPFASFDVGNNKQSQLNYLKKIDFYEASSPQELNRLTALGKHLSCG